MIKCRIIRSLFVKIVTDRSYHMLHLLRNHIKHIIFHIPQCMRTQGLPLPHRPGLKHQDPGLHRIQECRRSVWNRCRSWSIKRKTNINRVIVVKINVGNQIIRAIKIQIYMFSSWSEKCKCKICFCSVYLDTYFFHTLTYLGHSHLGKGKGRFMLIAF